VFNGVCCANMVCYRADVLSMTTVDFMSKADAIEYCERNGTFISFKYEIKVQH